MDIPDDHTPELDAYIIRAFYTRGEIIENFILLERIMDEFIAMEFSETLERRLQCIPPANYTLI